jgi:hypothetical protein
MKVQIRLSAFDVYPLFDSLIVIDRNVDKLSSLLTQFAYGNSIDERFDSICGVFHLPSSVKNDMRF